MQSVTISNIFIKREIQKFNKYFIAVAGESNFSAFLLQLIDNQYKYLQF